MYKPTTKYHTPDYIELKFNRPNALLKDGRDLTNCFVNANIVTGTDQRGNLVNIDFNEVEGITEGKGFIKTK